MTNLTINNKQSLLAYLKENLVLDINMSVIGVARLAGVSDTSIVRASAFGSLQLAEFLAPYGFEASAFIKNGIPPKAVILILQYFAFEARKPKEEAKQMFLTFSMLGYVELVKELNKTPEFKTPSTFSEALLLAAEQQGQIEEQQKKLEAQKPKVAYAEAVEGTENAMPLTPYAKSIGVGRNLLFAQLRDLSILTLNNEPYQRYIQQGYFTMTQSVKGCYVFPVTLITGKGQTWVYSKLVESSFVEA